MKFDRRFYKKTTVHQPARMPLLRTVRFIILSYFDFYTNNMIKFCWLSILFCLISDWSVVSRASDSAEQATAHHSCHQQFPSVSQSSCFQQLLSFGKRLPSEHCASKSYEKTIFLWSLVRVQRQLSRSCIAIRLLAGTARYCNVYMAGLDFKLNARLITHDVFHFLKWAFRTV